MTFIGVDPSAGDKPMAYVALDHECNVIVLSKGNMEEVMAFAAGQSHSMIAVCAPRQPNKKLMVRPEMRESLIPSPNPGRWLNARVVEYLLRCRNIRIPLTPHAEEKCPRWMQMSFSIFQRLNEFGYKNYPNEQAERQVLEVYPHASYAVMLNLLPFPKHTIEGRLQRQLILNENGVNVTDPMIFFEEITRYKLLNGVLPQDILFSSDELDALVGAFTAWVAAQHPSKVTVLGDPDEGQVVLPIDELKPYY